MTDIVKRLRLIRGNFVIPIESPPIFQWADEAADEIERLTAEREKWCHHAAFYCHGHAKTTGSDFDEAWADYQDYIADEDT